MDWESCRGSVFWLLMVRPAVALRHVRRPAQARLTRVNDLTGHDFEGVRWIFFDWGGTLKDEFAIYRNISTVCVSYLGSAGVEADEEALYDRLIELERIDARIQLSLALTEFGVPEHHVTGAMVSAEAELRAQPSYEGVDEMLSALQGSFTMGVISNHRKGLDQVLCREGLSSFFDVVVGSGDVGLAKPDPAIFRHALRLADCDPGMALMVGDHPLEDISGARSAGMRTVRVRQGVYAGDEPGSAGERADAEISDIRLLPSLLGVGE